MTDFRMANISKREAYENLKDYLDNNSNDYETYCYLRDCADTLAPPDPDPITGLVPCGCGGKAVIHDHQNYGEPGMNYWVGCDNQKCDCTVGMYLDETGQFEKKEDAIKAWNTAMGWKGDEK